MTFETSPQDDLITRVEELDEALRQDSTGTLPSGNVPPSIFAALKLLRGAFATSRSPEAPIPPAAAPEACVPSVIGRFQVSSRLGAGSYGVVYRAFDTVLKREVALKLPRLVTALTDPLLRRFLRESEAAARLHHPHIVPVYEAGMVESTAYIAAEYCPGVSLEAWLATRTAPLDPRLTARLMIDLADAIEHAHETGILHRDLKPGNILICWELGLDETAVDVPEHALTNAKVTDFGLARFLDEETWTASGGLVGTIAYMAPEQAEGQSAALGLSCDVYSLGVILYELLTGVRPHQGNSNADTLRRVCEEEPMPPRKRQPQIPRDLESICLKCLRKQPAKRYATARDLKEDLQRFLNGEATVARPLSVTEQVIRAFRRHPGWVSFGVASVAAVVLGVLATSWHFRELNAALVQSNNNLDAAERQQLRAEQNEAKLAAMLYVSDMQHALHHWNIGNSEGLRQRLEKYRHDEELRGVEWELLEATAPVYQAHVAAHREAIYAAALSPDQQTLATVGVDRVVRLWDVATQSLQGELTGHTDEINGLCFHPRGHCLATASDDRTVRVWDLKTRTVKDTLPHQHTVFSVAYSPDGSQLVTGGKENLVRVWAEDGTEAFQLEPFAHMIEQLKFAPDGKLAVAAGFVELWDLKERKRLDRLAPPEAKITTIEFSPDGKLLAGGSYEKHVMLWDVAGGSQLVNWEGHRDPVHDVEFSPGGDLLFSCGRDGTVRQWPVSNVWDGSQRVESAAYSQDSKGSVPLEAHTGRTWSMTFVPAQRLLATTGHDGSLRYWSLLDLQKPRFAAPGQSMSMAVFSGEMQRVIAPAGDQIVAWDRRTGNQVSVLDLEPGARGWGISADGTRVALSLPDASIRVQWLTGEGKPLLLRGHEVPPSWLLFPSSHPDRLISAGTDGTVRCWDLRAGVELYSDLVGDPEPVRAALSPDGSLVACADGNNTVVRSISTWELVAQWPCTDKRRPQALAFSADNHWLAVGTEDFTIELRPLARPDQMTLLTGSLASVTSVAFSPDGRTLISGTAEGAIQAWHVPSGQELGVLFQEEGVGVASLCFSPDGKQLLAALRQKYRAPRYGLLLWDAR